jgi:transcriptional regulator with XRE-family HTH domain
MSGMPAARVIGSAIADLRHALAWSQAELARRAGVSQALISRIERGKLDQLTLAASEGILAAMGARLTIGVDAPYLADRRRQREPAHARLSAHVAGWLRRAGWSVATEVEVGGDRSRGWIDILAWHPQTGMLLVIELKTEIHDLGAIQRTLGWYGREAWVAARRLGWRPRIVHDWLLLLATEANDVRAAHNRDGLGADFPTRAREMAAIVEGTFESRSRRGVAMVDPRSRRAGWIRPLRIDGRRSPAPYEDYADFMRALEGGQRGRRCPRCQ